jgi:hypothetical protein
LKNPAPQEEKKSQEIEAGDDTTNKAFYAVIQLERPILVQHNSLVIGSKLDKDIAEKSCRLAFSGQVL